MEIADVAVRTDDFIDLESLCCDNLCLEAAYFKRVREKRDI